MLKENEVSGIVVDAAIKVHSALGPGLLEGAYEACLKHELGKRGLDVETQKALPLVYDGMKVDVGYRLDMLVNGVVIVVFKSVEKLTDIHRAQVLSYLKLSGIRLGLLFNFNVMRLRDGIHRFANKLPD